MDEKKIAEKLTRKAVALNQVIASVYDDTIELRITTPIAYSAEGVVKVLENNLKSLKDELKNILKNLDKNDISSSIDFVYGNAQQTRDGVTFGHTINYWRTVPPTDKDEIVDIVKKHVKVT
jgi:hypothetical protein